jgi:hypothetical protein
MKLTIDNFSKVYNIVSDNFTSSNKSQKTKNNNKKLLINCEKMCDADENCKGYSYDIITKKCITSTEQIKPIKTKKNIIIGNKKATMELNGTYNIYQNNLCINSSIFDKNAMIDHSLNIKTNSKGIPVIPTQTTCSVDMSNNFIFTDNNEIITFDTEHKNNCGDYNQNSDCNVNQVRDIKCLQCNNDNSVSKEQCTNTNNQKWVFDKMSNTIRNWNGKCLTIDTNGKNIYPSVKPYADSINNKFILREINQQENFTTDNILEDKQFSYLLYTIYIILLVLLALIMIK